MTVGSIKKHRYQGLQIMAPPKIQPTALPQSSTRAAADLPLKKKRQDQSNTAQAFNRPERAAEATGLNRAPSTHQERSRAMPGSVQNAMKWTSDGTPKPQVKLLQNQGSSQRIRSREAEPRPNQDKENDKIRFEKGLRSLTAMGGSLVGAALMAGNGSRYGAKGLVVGGLIGYAGGQFAGDKLGWGLAKIDQGFAKTHEWLINSKNHNRSPYDLY
jgi:hypothetical protein